MRDTEIDYYHNQLGIEEAVKVEGEEVPLYELVRRLAKEGRPRFSQDPSALTSSSMAFLMVGRGRPPNSSSLSWKAFKSKRAPFHSR